MKMGDCVKWVQISEITLCAACKYPQAYERIRLDLYLDPRSTMAEEDKPKPTQEELAAEQQAAKEQLQAILDSNR